jgi:hypothetical protein
MEKNFKIVWMDEVKKISYLKTKSRPVLKKRLLIISSLFLF